VTRQDPVDLDVVVDLEVQGIRAEHDAGPRFDMSGVSAAAIVGDESQLTRLVRNLLSNAGRYAAGEVVVALTETAHEVLLTVSDDGPGVAEADRERVFERFVRLDEARSARDGGSGLGLAIVRDIAVAHGAAVTVGEAPGGGARFEVRFAV
jgi:signal transduction histidine kinase